MSNPTDPVRTVFCQAKSGNYIAHQSHVTCEVCAQPEGEAQQAEPYELADDDEVRFPNDTQVAIISVKRYYELRGFEEAATLSPLCGAQHAESGKESLVARLRAHDDERLYREADVLMSEAADEIERLQARAAQLDGGQEGSAT